MNMHQLIGLSFVTYTLSSPSQTNVFICIVRATLPKPLRLGSYWFSLLQSSFGMLQTNTQMLPWFALQKAQGKTRLFPGPPAPPEMPANLPHENLPQIVRFQWYQSQKYTKSLHHMQKFFTSKMSKNIIYSDLGSFPPFPPPCIGWQVFHPRGRIIYVITQAGVP